MDKLENQPQQKVETCTKPLKDCTNCREVFNVHCTITIK